MSVAAGSHQTVIFTLFVNQLGFYNQEMDFVVEPGTIEIMIGTSSEDLPLTTTVEITGQPAIITDKTFFSEVRVD